VAEAVIKSMGLTKVYGEKTAVNNVNMTVNRGDIYGFIGANGAGKTTFIRMIVGLIKPTSGTFELLGASNGAGLDAARKKVGSIVETPALLYNMNAHDCLTAHQMLYGKTDAQKVTDILKLVGLGDTGKKKVKDFSLGMKQRLAIAGALVNNPEILILDEPTNGMDPQGIVEIRNFLIKLAKDGMTILISSHILSELQQLATRIGIIRDGALIDEFDIKSLGKQSLEKYYLSKVGV